MGRHVIADSVYSVVHLGDRVLVGARLIKGDRAELRQHLGLGRYRGLAPLGRHRSAVHGSQDKREALRLAPVAERLGDFGLRRRRREGVGDDQAVPAVIRDRCRQRICRILRLRDRDDHFMRRHVVGHAVHPVVHLGDRVPVGARLIKGDRAELRQHLGLGRYRGLAPLGRHRSAVHGSQDKREALRLAPVAERLGDFGLRRRRREGVGDDQAVLAVILDRSRQGVGIRILRDRDHYRMRRGVVRHTVHSVVYLGDRVPVGAVRVKADLAELCQDLCFGRDCCLASLRRHRGSVHRSKNKREALRLAPVAERLGHLRRRFAGSEGVFHFHAVHRVRAAAGGCRSFHAG